MGVASGLSLAHGEVEIRPAGKIVVRRRCRHGRIATADKTRTRRINGDRAGGRIEGGCISGAGCRYAEAMGVAGFEAQGLDWNVIGVEGKKRCD